MDDHRLDVAHSLLSVMWSLVLCQM